MGLSKILTTSLLALGLLSQSALADPSPAKPKTKDVSAAASDWWFANIERQGTVPFGGDDFKIFRNVQDYGAKGDGNTDDTEAINSAITDGQRCGKGCDSSTTTPALVYFPPGTYKVSAPIIAYYYTDLVGDLNDLPVLKASADFEGIAVIDANPYDGENNWFTNQNNFFRQIRNFNIDLTDLPMTTGTGIHWQVAQATSLQNIVFDMIEDSSEENAQQGIFMENGSGGWISDLVFNGGKYGAFFGSQQFTVRNLEFNNCNTAIYQIWNWVWTFQGLNIKGCGVGIDLSAGDASAQTVGSTLILDSTFADTPIGIKTLYDPGEGKITNGTLVLDNVDMSSNVPIAIQNSGTETTVLEGNAKIAGFAQGRVYTSGSDGEAVQGAADAVSRPAALTDDSGKIVTKSKPQYADVPASNFVSVKSKGAKGDGSTDDTAAIQAVFDGISDGQIVYFDHGAYIMTDTVKVPANVKIVGEMWPLIMAGGDSAFQDQSNPKVMWQVGEKGSSGTVEIQDIIFQTKGPQPGAILVEWNVAGDSKGSAGMWDTHFRIGGSAGTELQSDKCSKTPKQETKPDPECFGSFMLMHVTSDATVYMENTWLWVADHELDISDHNQINLYNGRGILIESTKGAWLWGTASEHSVLYNYQLNKAQNVFMGLIQTETAYMQGNPDATVPFDSNESFSDPDWSSCDGDNCARTWGMRVLGSSDFLLYGGGLYSFFDNYAQECLDTEDCQQNMIDIQDSTVELLCVSTKASVNMINVDGQGVVKHADNVNNFCASVAKFES